ncbi:MAG TPA: hypothetical protein VFT13_01350 [Candidatus Krumholzibacteria bacterium]|nr:hypothetical protein [Candidatus Krumholzibacteria bacterium]
MRKRFVAFAALAVVALAVAACDDAPESGRATIVVTNINNGSPLESDVSTDSLVYEDLVPVSFLSRPYNQFITAPRGDAIIEKYRIEWARTDGGTGTLATREEITSIFVPVDGTASGVIRLVSWQDKSGPVLGPLVGTNNVIAMTATITFFAREVGTEHDIETQAVVGVHFADTAN